MMLDENFDEVDDVESVMFHTDLLRYQYDQIDHYCQNFLPIEFDNKEQLGKEREISRRKDENSYVLKRIDIWVNERWKSLSARWRWEWIESIDVPMKMRISQKKPREKNEKKRREEKKIAIC